MTISLFIFLTYELSCEENYIHFLGVHVIKYFYAFNDILDHAFFSFIYF